MVETNMVIFFVILIVAITIAIVLAILLCRTPSPPHPPPPPHLRRNGQLVRRPSENKEQFAQGGEPLRIPEICFGNACIDKATVDKGISNYVDAVSEMHSSMKKLRGKLDDNTSEYEQITKTIDNINKNREAHISELKRRLDKATERRRESVIGFEKTIGQMKEDQEEAAEDIDDLISVRP